MKWDEQAQRLRRKAAIDEQAMIILMSDDSSADEVVGFHALSEDEAPPLDRVSVAECVRTTREWVNGLLGGEGKTP